jgi:hypothetical protein
MAIIGSSPLGLVGLQSNDPNGVYSKYNNRSRNSGQGMVSLFSGDRIIRPFPGYKIGGSKPTSNVYDNNAILHSNDLYNTTIPNIVDKLKNTKAALKLTDFAYLKDVGVYPNNRLMIARRFATPQLDNIMYNKGSDRGSMVTLISWKPPSEGDFLSISFGEEWEDADATFKSILSDVGKDFNLPGDLGELLSGGGGMIPLPGSTELLQRQFFVKLGILDKEQEEQIPEGNPNLIKQAKQRKLVQSGQKGSGLNCKVSIKMTCTWEQKYIQGVDPTLAWMDIVSMVGRFGTSNSQSYGVSSNFKNKISEYLENPSTLIKETIEALQKSIDLIVTKVKELFNGQKSIDEDDKEDQEEENAEKKNTEIDNLTKKDGLIDQILGYIGDHITKKYRERILGVLNNLSGMPSTPWHVTLGNPLRPFFCSGDMLIGDVDLKFGPNLSFNDLPTTITADFTLTNARPWGLQEILAKFNSGHVRVLSYSEDDKGKLVGYDIGDFSIKDDNTTKISENNDFTLTNSPNTKNITNQTNVDIPVSNNTETNQQLVDDNVEVNPDANSEQPIVEEKVDNKLPVSEEGTRSYEFFVAPTVPPIFTAVVSFKRNDSDEVIKGRGVSNKSQELAKIEADKDLTKKL